MTTRELIDVAAGRVPADVVLRNARIVNVLSDEIIDGDIALAGDTIAGVGRYEGRNVIDVAGRHVCPGFIDAHVHIESSLLAVPEFARVVSPSGTVAVVTDPHEIANVMGTDGIRYMLASSRHCPLFVYVMLSSCVPASGLEGSAATLDAADLAPLLNDRWVLGLAEMMNYPGVVAGDPEVLAKLEMSRGRVIDGHAPGLSGLDLQAYCVSGIASDHECTTLAEAREKLRAGLTIMMREGSQARNLDALLPLVSASTLDRFLFVTDDKDVDDLMVEGHIDHIVRRAIAGGLPPIWALRIASYNAARYFGLPRLGAIAPGYQAALVVLDDLPSCRVHQVFHGGRLVAEGGACLHPAAPTEPAVVTGDTMNVRALEPRHLAVAASGATAEVHVIEMIEDQLVTGRSVERLAVAGGAVQPDPARDIAKIVVIDRHHASGRLGIGFIRGFGLTGGAMASTVGHDAHNLVVVGTCDRDILAAAAHTITLRGGLCAVRDGTVLADMPLPIAGLMSARPAGDAARELRRLHAAVAEHLSCVLRRPYMALSFMSLSVIGALKVTDRGLIDVDAFRPIELLA